MHAHSSGMTFLSIRSIRIVTWYYCLLIISSTAADVHLPPPLDVETHRSVLTVEPCENLEQSKRQGGLLIGFRGHATQISDVELRLVEQMLAASYDAISSSTCQVGSRNVYEVMADKETLPSFDSTDEFHLKVTVVYLCKGCSENTKMLSEPQQAHRAKGRQLFGEVNSQRQLVPTKGEPKKHIGDKSDSSIDKHQTSTTERDEGVRTASGHKATHRRTQVEASTRKRMVWQKGQQSSTTSANTQVDCVCDPPLVGTLLEDLMKGLGSLRKDGKIQSISQVVSVQEISTKAILSSVEVPASGQDRYSAVAYQDRGSLIDFGDWSMGNDSVEPFGGRKTRAPHPFSSGDQRTRPPHPFSSGDRRSRAPSSNPSARPTIETAVPTEVPTADPTVQTNPPTSVPETEPPTTAFPTISPTLSILPTMANATDSPSVQPSRSASPTETAPSRSPSASPTTSEEPTTRPTLMPTFSSNQPTVVASESPTLTTAMPTIAPSQSPTITASASPTVTPSQLPTVVASENPTITTAMPTFAPSQLPTVAASAGPTGMTDMPTPTPSQLPTNVASANPTGMTDMPTPTPSQLPTVAASANPTGMTDMPTPTPSQLPTVVASASPTLATAMPTIAPSQLPTVVASESPTLATSMPTIEPSQSPTVTASASPSSTPTIAPSQSPTITASESPSSVPTATCALENGDECCETPDCPEQGTLCFLRRCISEGRFRFTLSWRGDDDLDLYVQPPSGNLIFFGFQEDPISGGTFEGDPNQGPETGTYVESTFFPDDAPMGTFFFFVAPFLVRGEADTWTLSVTLDDETILETSGTGLSDTFQFVFFG